MADKPKVIAGSAYVKLLEKGLYGLFRDVYTEEQVEGAEPHREKMGSIGPISLLREMQKGEEGQVVLKTSHPNDPGRMISLVETKG